MGLFAACGTDSAGVGSSGFGSCLRTGSSCVDYIGTQYSQAACETTGGVYSSATACSTSGQVGSCRLEAGNAVTEAVYHYFGTIQTVEELQATCEYLDGQFTAGE